MGIRKAYPTIGAVILTAMLLLPTTSAWSEEARESGIVLHISTLSDGKKEKTVSLSQAGTDKTMSINIPNGARIVNASMNITGLPFVDGGTDCPENVTVDLGNDGTPEWAFQGMGYGQMGNQTLFSNGNASAKIGVTKDGVMNTSATVRLPKNAVITNANLNISGGGFKVLLIYADPTITYPNDVVTALTAFKDDFTAVDKFDGSAGTPTLSLLKEYGACYVWIIGNSAYYGESASWQNSASLGNALADYVDGGGGVVTASMVQMSSYTPGGRFSGSYMALTPVGGYGAGGSPFSLSTVYLPNHPIMANVQSVTFSSGGPTGACTPAGGGQAVFKWQGSSTNDGAFVMTMANGVNRVDFQMNAWSDKAPKRGNYGMGWTGDGDDLVRNSLLWTGSKAVGSGNFSLDYGNDGSVDWMNPTLNKTVTVPDFSAQLNNYLAKASPTGIDPYGNEYVDIPIGVASNSTTSATIGNLSIIYKYTKTATINPATGNLASALDALVPKVYDMKSSNITIGIFSNHTCRVKISDISIDYTLYHPAVIQTRTPEDSIVFMNENSTQDFSITAWDPYDFPMCVTWSVNKKVYLQNEWNMSWFADYDANGTYSVAAMVDNGEQKVTTNWLLIVKNVNRKPMIDSFEPEKKFTMDENSSAAFTVTASDPDKDELTYAWYADGKRVSCEEATYEYKTTYASAGKHEVKVTVLDAAGASAVQSWDITVNNVNAAPELTDSSPGGDDVSMNENSTRKFSVTDLSIDGDKHVISWMLDGNSTGVAGRSYEYATGFDSAGRHDVSASISDGKLATTRTWNVNVVDVNRPPVAAIAAPAPGAEFMVGEEITLDGTRSSDPDGDQLTMSWSEGLKTLGTGTTLTVKLSKGKHTIVLKVDDGRKNGQATTQVQVFVRYIDFSGALTVDTEMPVEGKQIMLSAVLTNRGDGSIEELLVTFRVDGADVSTTDITDIGADSEYQLEFQWKAVRGDHKLEVSVNNQNFSKLVTVEKKPVPVTKEGDILMPLAIVAMVLVVALAAGGYVLAGRRKRAGAIPEQEARVKERPQVQAPYKPMQKAPPVAASASAADAKKAIDKTDKILTEAEKVGLDTTKARSLLKVAKNMQGMGKADKAVEFCKKAEDAVG